MGRTEGRPSALWKKEKGTPSSQEDGGKNTHNLKDEGVEPLPSEDGIVDSWAFGKQSGETPVLGKTKEETLAIRATERQYPALWSM